jgi:CheY-like chemotaxis protein
MSRILLADDSPHAQRMGERILQEEGFEVVTVTDGETALLRLSDVDPDLVLADVFLPSRNGYEICRYIKEHPRYQHTRVILTAGALEPVDEEQASAVKADGIIKKPFEASMVVEMITPLIEGATHARGLLAEEYARLMTEQSPGAPATSGEAGETGGAGTATQLSRTAGLGLLNSGTAASAVIGPVTEGMGGAATAASFTAAEIDPERVRAAVTLALDAALPAMIEEITTRVLVALGH